MHVLAAIYPFGKTGLVHLLVPVTEQLMSMTIIFVCSDSLFPTIVSFLIQKYVELCLALVSRKLLKQIGW